MQLPDYIKAKQGPSLVDRALANVGSPRPPHVSTQNNRFALVDSAGSRHLIQTLYLDIVIFDLLEHKSKLFMDPTKKWTPESKDPPLCWSDNGIGPSSQVPPPAEFETGPTCELCPQNAWGSKISDMGSSIKACRDEQKVAALVPGFDGVYLMVIPPNSLKPWAAYVTKFKGQGFDFTDVLTRLTFKEGVQGTLEFAPSPNPWLTEDLVALRDKATAAKAADTVIGRLDKPRQGAIAAPAQAVVSATSSGVVADPFVSAPATPSAVAPLAPTPQTSNSIEPTRRKRRTKEEIAADEAKKAAPPVVGETVRAPFRQPAEGGQPNGSFGIAPGATPGEQMAAEIAKLFG